MHRHKQLTVEQELKIKMLTTLVVINLSLQLIVDVFSYGLNKFEILHACSKFCILALAMILIRIGYMTVGTIDFISKIGVIIITYTNFNEIMDIYYIKMMNLRNIDQVKYHNQYNEHMTLFIISSIKFGVSLALV